MVKTWRLPKTRRMVKTWRLPKNSANGKNLAPAKNSADGKNFAPRKILTSIEMLAQQEVGGVVVERLTV